MAVKDIGAVTMVVKAVTDTVEVVVVVSSLGSLG